MKSSMFISTIIVIGLTNLVSAFTDSGVSNKSKPYIGTSICSKNILNKGYSCCPYKCEVIYTDEDGTWGIYDNEWCGCNPDFYVPDEMPEEYKEMYEDYIRRYIEVTSDDKEIEKKWLIDKEKIPYDLSAITVLKADIKQTYICFDPEIRVREYTDETPDHTYEMTIKTNLSEDGLIRDETNIDLNQEQYNNMAKKQEGNVIYKTRYQLLDNHEILAIDIFHGDLDGLAYLEIEFSTKEESDAYKTPDWAIKDVTNDIRYKNGDRKSVV